MFEVSEGIRVKNDENGYDFRISYTRFPFSAAPVFWCFNCCFGDFFIKFFAKIIANTINICNFVDIKHSGDVLYVIDCQL